MITEQQALFYKLVVTTLVDRQISQHKKIIQQELVERASDPNILKRRFRMLSQISEFESQIQKKIYNFHGDSIDDYVCSVQLIFDNLRYVVNRNS